MENKEIAIKITGLKKRYKLGQIGGGTLQGDLQSWWARIRGKEDPNSKIGSDRRSDGKTFMALNGVDMTVRKGEALGIIGHNGAGKSTLLKLLSRVTAPTEGEICIKGRIASMLEVGTGFNGEMTGRENVYMNGAILGMTKAEVDAKMEQIIDFSEVREFIDTPVKRYSSGMYVKLAFSVAAHLDSEIMIMDEVLAVGDMAFQKKCLDKMREAANQEGRTVLYVSHNMNTIRQLCDRCVVLDKGKVVFEGGVKEAIEVYMNSTGAMDNSYRYDTYPRSSTEPRTLQFKALSFCRDGKNIWNKNEQVNAKLCCFANGDCNNVYLRFEIRTAVGGVIATMFSKDPISARQGETVELNLTFDSKGLVPAKYAVDMLAYVETGYNTQIVYDKVGNAFLFEVVDDSPDALTWLPQHWGYVQLSDVTVR